VQRPNAAAAARDKPRRLRWVKSRGDRTRGRQGVGWGLASHACVSVWVCVWWCVVWRRRLGVTLTLKGRELGGG
jgi:hypothetical protein